MLAIVGCTFHSTPLKAPKILFFGDTIISESLSLETGKKIVKSFFNKFESTLHSPSIIDDEASEIEVTLSNTVSSIETKKILVGNERQIKEVKLREVPKSKTKKRSFKNFKSSYKEIAQYWPTQNENPLAKSAIQINFQKLKIAKPVRVAKNTNKAIEDSFKKLEALSKVVDVKVIKEDEMKALPFEEQLVNAGPQRRDISLSNSEVLEIQNLAYKKLSVPNIQLLASLIDMNEFKTRLMAYKDSPAPIKPDQKLIDQSLAAIEPQKGKEVVKNGEALVEDEITVKKSAVQKNDNPDKKIGKTSLIHRLASNPVKPIPKKEPVIGSDEMVFFDVEKPSKSKVEEMVEKASIISSAVEQAIQREMKTNPVIAYNNASPAAMMKLFAKQSDNETVLNKRDNGKTNLKITPRVINISNGSNSDLRNFDVQSLYNSNEIFTDDGTGRIQASFKLNNINSTYSGVLLQRDVVRTRFNVPLGEEVNEFEIPVLSVDGFRSFFEKNPISSWGGFLFVHLDDGVESIDIDNDYAEVFYFDSNYKQVKESERYDYILFAGVRSGNTVLRSLGRSGEISEQIIFISLDEVSFAVTETKASNKVKLELYEEGSLGKTSALNLDEDSLGYFNLKTDVKKLGLNTFEVEVPQKSLTMKPYFEVKTDSDFFIVGQNGNGKITLPSMDNLNLVLDNVNLREMNGSCIVQGNSEKPIEAIEFEGHVDKGSMPTEIFYLNDKGEFNSDVDGVVTRFYVLGSYQGTLYLKVTYTDNSVDLIRSYCSSGTYLIENL
ncbi:MAG: hypothetical protein ACPGJV_08180 [Bacteriovoracaceae bacterium]